MKTNKFKWLKPDILNDLQRKSASLINFSSSSDKLDHSLIVTPLCENPGLEDLESFFTYLGIKFEPKQDFESYHIKRTVSYDGEDVNVKFFYATHGTYIYDVSIPDEYLMEM